MKVQREWNNELDLFEALEEVMGGDCDADVIEGLGIEDVQMSPEHGEYREHGTVDIHFKGRHFRLALEEII